MQKLLTELANINSYSYNIPGLAQVNKLLSQKFQDLFSELDVDLNIHEIDIAEQELIDDKGLAITKALGKCLSISKASTVKNGLNVLIMGHTDTVFPPEIGFNSVKQIDENTLGGPGVSDLKGGIVIAIYALLDFERRIKELDASQIQKSINWHFFTNPDEEIGSPSSQIVFPELAKNHDFALVLEPSLPDGSVVFRRKGTGNYTVIFKGKAAHVGREFDKGISAIQAASNFIYEAQKLNNNEGIILNFGKIQGGGPLNVVPDNCVLKMNLRVEEKDQAAFVEKEFKQINEICKKNFPGIEIEIHGKLNRAPKIPDAKTQKLFSLLEGCAKELGQKFTAKNTGGACDGNNLLDLGLANIDTLGAIGANIHSKDEYILLDSLEQRSKLMSNFLFDLATGKIEL